MDGLLTVIQIQLSMLTTAGVLLTIGLTKNRIASKIHCSTNSPRHSTPKSIHNKLTFNNR